VTTEVEPTAPSAPPSTLDEERAVERALWKSVFVYSVAAIPVCIAIWVGMVWLSLALLDSDWGLTAPLVMGACVGLVAGAFFGGWAGFLAKAHTLDELDRKTGGH
jgi:hypothetical protein